MIEDPLASIEKLYDDLQTDNDQIRAALAEIKTWAFELGVKDITTLADASLQISDTKKAPTAKAGVE